MSATTAQAPAQPAPNTMSPEEKLSGDMLMLTSGFMMCAAALWLAVYWSLGHQYSTAIPLIFQGLSAATVLLYWKTRKLMLFAFIQLGLILFAPFAMQWAIGNFVTSSGVRTAPTDLVPGGLAANFKIDSGGDSWGMRYR